MQGQSTPLYHDEALEEEDGGFDVCLACAIPIIEANSTVGGTSQFSANCAVWANPVQFALGLDRQRANNPDEDDDEDEDAMLLVGGDY